MTKPSITKRVVKGSSLTYAELDTNFQNLADATLTVTAGSGGTAVVSDLNGNITLVAGSGIGITGNNTSKQITIENTSQGSNAFATIVVSGQNDVVADSVSDTLTLIAGSGITLTTNATNDSVTITNTGGEGGGLGFLASSEIDLNEDSAVDTVLFGPIDETRNFLLSAGGLLALQSENSDIIVNAESGEIKLQSNTVILGSDSESQVVNITTDGASTLKLSNDDGSSTASIEIESGADARVVIVTDDEVDITGGLTVSGDLQVDGTTGSTFFAGITAPKFVGAATQVDIVTYDTDVTGNHFLLFADGVTGDRDVQARNELTYNPVTETIDANITGNCGGNALSATALATSRTIGSTGDVSFTTAGFDGSANVTGEATLATVLGSPGSFTMANVTVDGKGRITAVSNGGSAISVDSADATRNVLFTDAASGTRGTLNVNNTNLTFNPSTGRLTCTQLATGTLLTTTFASYKETIHSLGSTSGTISADPANGNVQTLTMTGNITINGLANASAGHSVTLIINTNGTNRTLTSSMKFAGGVNTLSITNTTDILHIFYDGTTYFASLIKGYI